MCSVTQQISQNQTSAAYCGPARAAELLEVHLSTVIRLARRGALAAVPMDGARGPLVFLVEDVLALRAVRSGGALLVIGGLGIGGVLAVAKSGVP